MRWELAEADPAQVHRLAAALQDLTDLRFIASNPENRNVVCLPAMTAPAQAGTKLPRYARDGKAAGQTNSALYTLARLLIRRGLTGADAAARYLNPCIDHLHPPEQMTGVRSAVDRLDSAIERREPMLIYGDYDVDGTMAIIILKTAIELCGGSADFHVPHRIREGYDLRDDVIERAAAAGIRLIILSLIHISEPTRP